MLLRNSNFFKIWSFAFFAIILDLKCVNIIVQTVSLHVKSVFGSNKVFHDVTQLRSSAAVKNVRWRLDDAAMTLCLLFLDADLFCL